MKTAQIADRLKEIVESGKRARLRAVEYGKVADPRYKEAAELGGTISVVEHFISDIDGLLLDIRGKR